MNRILLFFLYLFFSCSVFSQTKVELQFSATSLEKVISKIEKKFNIKYSYVDSLLVNKQLTLAKNKYSIDEVNHQIETQTQLKTTKISDRFYTVFVENKPEIKTIQLKEVIIESFLIDGIKKQNQKFILSPQKQETLAGVTDTDVLLSLQQLPGVKSINETATGLFVRGGTSDQNLLLFDGIRLFHSGHLFGMISGINSNAVKTVNFFTNGINPKFGERISSVIDLQTSNDLVKKTKTIIGANALNVDAFLQTPIVKNKLDIQFSARKSFTEFLQLYTFNQLAEKVFQNTDFKEFNDENKFQFYDYTAKIVYKPSAKSTFSFTNLSINNNLNFNYKIDDESVSNQQMKMINDGYSINWSKKYSNQFSHKLLLYYSIYDFKYQKRNEEILSNEFETFKKLNRIINSGAELNFNSVLNDKLSLDYGFQIAGNDISHLFTSYNQDFSIDLNLKHLYNISHSGFFNFGYSDTLWNLQTGFRYNYFTKINAQTIEPRFFLQRKIAKEITFQFSFDRKTQSTSQVKENTANDLSLENYVWVLADNKKYPIQKANQFSAALLFKKNNWFLNFESYYKTINGITSLNFGFFNQNTNQTDAGEGFVKGIDVFLQKKATTWRTAFSYSYQDSQNKFETINNGKYFKSNANNKHAVNFSFNKKWNNFSAIFAWFWHTGKPFSVINENGEITSLNKNNLQDYHRLDATFDYVFSKKEIQIKTGISFYNLYNKKTLLSREYERKYASFSDLSNPRYVQQDFYSLGFTPNIFVRMSF